MVAQIDTLLLVALPASGKSEVRTYLGTLTPQQCREQFHLGETVQLDDFPYVHLMRRIDEELAVLGAATIFFLDPSRPFKDPIEWGTLIALLNEDYADLRTRNVARPASAAQHLFARLEAARARVGGPVKIGALPSKVREELARRLEREAAELLAAKHAGYPDTLEGKTVVIEFARGGPDGASFPLPAPFGYAYSFAQLSEELLARAAVLYIWVTPEESRRKNVARTDPNDPGSILHHGVPLEVMLNDYGCDDIAYLLQRSGAPGIVEVTAHGKQYRLPLGRFDNRVDRTSFVRDIPRDRWPAEAIAALHEGLQAAFAELRAARG